MDQFQTQLRVVASIKREGFFCTIRQYATSETTTYAVTYIQKLDCDFADSVAWRSFDSLNISNLLKGESNSFLTP